MHNTSAVAAAAAMLFLSNLSPVTAGDSPQDPVSAVAREVRSLADLVRRPDGIHPADIAKRFGSGYERGQCDEFPKHGQLCQFHVRPREGGTGQITSMRLSAGGGAHSEVTWKLQSSACMTEAQVEALLGKGELVGVSIPYIPPGQTDRPPSYRQVSYDAIPSAVKPALVTTLFDGNCLVQATINILEKQL